MLKGFEIDLHKKFCFYFRSTNMEVPGYKQTDSDDHSTGIQCDPCLCDGRTVTAEWYCTECSEFMCDNCARAHRNSRATRNHKLLERDAMPKKKLATVLEKFCANHANKHIEYFCGKHEQLCCSVCVTLGHSQCAVFYIDDIAGGFSKSQEYQDLLKEIELLETKLTETKKQSDQNCENVNQCFTTLISDIQHFRTKINNRLDELEKNVREEAQKIKKSDLKSMEFISTQSESIQKLLREMSSTLESLKKYKQNQQLFISSKHYLAEVMEIKHKIEEISFKNHITRYSFQCNEDILNYLDTCCKLNVVGFQNIMSKNPKQIKAKFEKTIDIQHKQDRKSNWCITGSDMLTCDTLALTDRNNYSVKLVDLHTDAITSFLQLADQPEDLTCMDSNTLVVTCDTNLTFLKFDGKLSIVKKIPVEDVCCGITSHQNKLFVTFVGKKPCVEILNSTGTVLQTIKTNSQGQSLYVTPQYITLSTDGQTIYVSDSDQNTVTSYSMTDGQINVYKHDELKCPTGLTVIENKFLFVCGHLSQNLHEISFLCEHIQIMLDTEDVGGPPCTVLYNRTNNRIYISCWGNKFVSVFKLE